MDLIQETTLMLRYRRERFEASTTVATFRVAVYALPVEAQT